MIEAKDIHEGRIELPNDWYATVTLESDDDVSAPWKEEDGHGPVSGWRGMTSKRPGERVLVQDHERALFYDFAEAVVIARRDGWGCSGGTGDHVHPTAGQQAACAAEQDFRRMRGYAQGEWSYVVILVTVFDAEGEKVDRDVLGGVESDDRADGEPYWKEIAAEMLNGLTQGYVGPCMHNPDVKGYTS